MDADQIEGAARNSAGKVQDFVGGLMGDTRTQAQGRINQVAGSAQGVYGQARDSVDNLLDELAGYTKDQPLVALAAALGAGMLAGLLIWGGARVSRRD
jgi:uncharacterized protein YjbJ (UPF0337 family)